MVRHLVFWTLKAEADGRSAAENGELFKSKAAALLGKVPGLLAMEVSTSVVSATDMPDRVDVALMSTHENVEAYNLYADHPDHLPIKAWAGTVTTARRVINYEI